MLSIKIQVETPLRLHFVSRRLATIKETLLNAGEDAETLEPSHTLSLGMENNAASLEKKINVKCNLAILPLGICPREVNTHALAGHWSGAT